ncbi:aldehyde oxidase 5 isoform X1 [Salmo trutta]|uniref:aldehyde oxidase 5 isoform X1 n=1 Tax=Salmo trutta TaxID=8032 RepID=UPI0011310179|nr:aldehyde oxidase 1-like isoform X1 [Salmo trutta]
MMSSPNSCSELIFYVNGQKILERNADPEEVLLKFLRRKVLLTGTKYGCGGGGCGACTVMVSRYDQIHNRVLHYTVNACLQPICTLHGAAVVTVEGIGSTKTKLHPVQERIAKAHGSQCGFCTPGMVMSMYTLLRNKPHPTMEDIREALGGNLCRCTGYRPIIDGFKTFCVASENGEGCCQNGQNGESGGKCCIENGTKKHKDSDISEELFHMDNVLPLDPSQDLIFPPELMIMGKKRACGSLCFQGDRLKLISPVDLTNLLELKTEYSEAPVVVGNTTIGPNMQLKGVHHPLIIYAGRVSDLHTVTWGKDGVSMGAVCTLSSLKEEMERAVREMEAERTRGYQALLQTLRCLAGKQIRNMATIGGNILSANPKYDLNSVLAALDCTLQVMSKENGTRTITLNEELFTGFGKTALRPDEVLLSIDIPYSKPWEFVSAFRQAQRREFAFSIVNAGMKVVFREGTNIVESLNIYYGGVGATLVKIGRTCQKLVGRSWGEELLADACCLLEEEVELSDSAHGGKVEYRKTLTTSFFFKFYMQVLQELRERDVNVCLLPLEYLSALKPFKNEVPQGHHSFQLVSNAQSSQDPVGHPMMHQAAFHQATGEAQYYDDIPPVQGELFVFMVTSTRAHAKIINIDPSEALGMTGVVTFLSAGDVPGQNRRMLFNNPEELFAEEEVSCVGQIIGAVVAESREQARRAAQRVKVTYQDLLPVFFTIEEAIQHQSFFDLKRKLERGDMDKAFETVDQILEDEIYLGGQEHFYMETQGLIAVPKGENGELELFVASQHSAYTQEVVGITLGIDSNKITCHVRRLGGAFGGKVMKIASLSAITAIAAVKTGRAVRCVLERGDDMLITSGRHPFLGKYKVGYNNDGTIMAADITYYSNGGCTLNESSVIMEKALLHMDNGYRIPNLRGRGLVCKTYLPSYTAFRGFGGPQGLMVMESVLHEVAVKCGLPPQKVREINMYREEECYTHHKQLFSPRNMLRCWDECLDKAGYHDRLQAIQQFNTSNRWKKRGISAVPMKFGVGFSKGFYNQGAALVNIYKDGSVLVAHGGTEMGQGINTKALQIASRILKVPMSSIHIKETCTGNIPNAAPSAASFGTDAVGMAVKDACEKLMGRLKPVMENHPKYTWQQWIFEAYCQKVSLSATGFFLGPHTGVDWENSEGPAYYYFTFGACCSEVEIDCLTGDHKNLRTDIVMDVGRSLNPALDIGQIEGGFVQGIGLYTIEELQFSPEGVLMTRGPSQYKIPALCDIPPQLNVHLLANAQNPHAIYSSKGIGEPPVFLASTIFFAIKEAVAAARRERGLGDSFPLSSPATSERIRMACEDQFTEMAPSPKKGTFKPWSINI